MYGLQPSSQCYNAFMLGIISQTAHSKYWIVGISVAIGSAMLVFPFSVRAAAPFGGRASFVKKCYNNTIYALLGPPRGGPYIWTKTTRTYKNGPPKEAGQWLLGLKSIPFLCLYSKQPLITLPGIAILMMGSSAPSSSGPSIPGIGSVTGAATKLLGL